MQRQLKLQLRYTNYVTLHYTTTELQLQLQLRVQVQVQLHYITHSTTLHSTTRRYTPLHFTTLHYTSLHFTSTTTSTTTTQHFITHLETPGREKMIWDEMIFLVGTCMSVMSGIDVPLRQSQVNKSMKTRANSWIHGDVSIVKWPSCRFWA